MSVVGKAWIVKLPALPDEVIVKVTFVECDRDPDDPTTVTVYVASAVVGVVKILKIDVAFPLPANVILLGSSWTTGHELPEQKGEVERLTVPENPLRLERKSVVEPLDPCGKVSVLGTAVIEKSGPTEVCRFVLP